MVKYLNLDSQIDYQIIKHLTQIQNDHKNLAELNEIYQSTVYEPIPYEHDTTIN